MARVRRIELTSASGAVPVHLDGEPFGELPITITVRPAALRVAVPGGSATVTA